MSTSLWCWQLSRLCYNVKVGVFFSWLQLDESDPYDLLINKHLSPRGFSAFLTRGKVWLDIFFYFTYNSREGDGLDPEWKPGRCFIVIIHWIHQLLWLARGPHSFQYRHHTTERGPHYSGVDWSTQDAIMKLLIWNSFLNWLVKDTVGSESFFQVIFVFGSHYSPTITYRHITL